MSNRRPADPAEIPPPTFGQMTLAAGIGAAVAIIAVVPPLVHFVSGPLGPIIGGFLAGSRVRAGGHTSVIVGLMLGAIVAVVALFMASFILVFLPVGEQGAGASLIVAAIAFVYASAMGTVGAYFGGRSARRPPNDDEEPARPL